MSEPQAILSPGVGYAVVLGLGLCLSFIMVGLTWLSNRYSSNSTKNVEEFTSASHSVKPGLIAAGIVSAWTWAATLLQSTSIVYKFGISGAWWYAAGATVQILLFAQNASRLKINAPAAHTFLEIIRVRWGRAGHFTFMFFALGTNVIVSSMLITGGSATVTSLTGMPTEAACMLIPVSVVLYILIGGMRASLMADYIHCVAVFSIIISLMSVVFAQSDLIGSPSKMYDLLEEAARLRPVEGNAGGSYLTMRSKGGIIFGVINLIGNFATIFNDQAYFQRAVASEPVSCVKAFMLGGSAWLSVPLGFATTMGLSAIVLTVDNPLSPSAVGAGLPAPAAAAALLGTTGACVMLVLLFLAVISSAAAELIAVSSIFTYDIYIPYINPKATPKQILFADHVAIVCYGVCMGFLGLTFNAAGISMGWLYLFMGVVLGSAVVPIAMSLLSANANRLGCICGAWIGVSAGVAAWLGTCAALNDGVLTVETTFQDYPMLAGNLASIGTSAIICLATSYIWPAHFDFDITRNMHLVPDSDAVPAPEKVEASEGAEKESADEKAVGAGELSSASTSIAEAYDENKDPAKLIATYRLAVKASIFLFVLLILVIPLPLFFSSHIYTKGGFTAWIVVAFVWVFYGMGAVVIFPIFESRKSIAELFTAIVRDVFGGGKESPSFKTLFEPSALSSALLLCSSTPAARLRAEPRRVSKLSSSGSEVDDFFTKRPRHVPSPTAPPPKRRRQVPTSDRSREGQSGSGDVLPSSALEVLPGGRAIGERAGREKGGGGSTRKGRSGGVGAPRPLGTRSKPSVEVTISSSPEKSRSSSPAEQPSSTQLDRGSDVLRDMALEKGWEGPARRPLTRPEAVAQGREAGVGGAASGSRLALPERAGSSTDTDGSKGLSTSSDRASRRASSTSRSSKELPPRRKPPEEVLILSSPNQTDLRDGALPPGQRPPPPLDFWGAGDVAPAKKKEKRVHGEASKRLATLSELGKRVVGSALMEEEDDIVDRSGSDDSGKGKGYESVADANKRKREEARVRLQESRLKKQLAVPAHDTPVPAARQDFFAASSAKGKNKSSTESCALCNKLFPAAELASHAETCFAQRAAAQPAAIVPSRAKPPPLAKKPPPPRPQVPAAAEAQNAALLADLNFSPPAAPRYDAKAKGKGRAIESPDEEGPPPQADDDEEFDNGLWENYEDFDEFASSRRGEVIDVGSDDDDVPLAARTYAQKRNGAQAGSSPPKGSIFISTLPPAIRKGYKQLYDAKPQTDAGGGREGPLAPQKMSAPAKKPFRAKRGGPELCLPLGQLCGRPRRALQVPVHFGGHTTRTTTLHGFPDDPTQHQVTFFNAGQSTSNSYGFSPFPLATCLSWIHPLLQSAGPNNQVILSIGGSLEETSDMLVILQAFAKEIDVVLGVECNASCPNIAGHPPPAYAESDLRDFVKLLAAHASPSLKVGIKLPLYTYATRFAVVISSLSSVSPSLPKADHPISFLTAINTLGQGLVFSEQITEVPQAVVAQKKKNGMFALPGRFGGLAGAAVHQLALGNVHRLSGPLRESKDRSWQSITLIGVGGVADAAGVERMRQAGASAVACATALGREGAEVFAKLSAKPA